MRKTVLILAAMVAVAAGALGAAVASGATHNAKEATAVVASHSVLLGDQKVESLTDQNGTQPQAWPYTATVTGTATDVDVYDAGGTATIEVGLYANLPSNTPGKLLAVGSIGKSVANAWNDITVGSASVTAGTKYWLAIQGNVSFRDGGTGVSCSTVGDSASVGAVGSSWSNTWTATGYCPASFYVNGTTVVGTTVPPPPVTTTTTSTTVAPPPVTTTTTSTTVAAPPPVTTSSTSSTTASTTTTAPTSTTNCAGTGTSTSNTVSQTALDGCGLPSMNTTGPPAGTNLTPSNGFTASTAGQTFNDLAVDGGISITANNVTIENSNITDVNPDSAAINVASGVTGVKIVNDSIHGTNAVQSGSLAFAVSYFGDAINGVTIDHTNFYNGDRILAGYGTVTNSYCLGGANFESGGSAEHDECIYTGGGAPGIRVIHDTLINASPYQTAAIFVDNPDYGGSGSNGVVDVENSLLAGGDYCIYGGQGNAGTNHTGAETITGNRFARTFYSTCGQYGPDAYLSGNVTWSGNVWDDTNTAINP